MPVLREPEILDLVRLGQPTQSRFHWRQVQGRVGHGQVLQEREPAQELEDRRVRPLEATDELLEFCARPGQDQWLRDRMVGSADDHVVVLFVLGRAVQVEDHAVGFKLAQCRIGLQEQEQVTLEFAARKPKRDIETVHVLAVLLHGFESALAKIRVAEADGGEVGESLEDLDDGVFLDDVKGDRQA